MELQSATMISAAEMFLFCLFMDFHSTNPCGNLKLSISGHSIALLRMISGDLENPRQVWKQPASHYLRRTWSG